MIKEPSLYALVPRATVARSKAPRGSLVAMPLPKKKTAATARAERTAEQRAKQAVDQADAILARIEDKVAGLAKEIARLQQRKKLLCLRGERIESEIITRIEAAGLEQVNGWKKTLICRPAPASVEVFDEDLLPAEYLRTPEPVAVPDKVKIKAALSQKDPVDVPGARLFQRLTLQRK